MFLVKEVILITGIILSTSLGLFEISNYYVIDNPQTESQHSSNKNSQSYTSENEYSKDFYQYLFQIQNKQLNKKTIQSKIQSFASEFEKKYLLAMIKKREGDFETAFDQLYFVLKDSPKHFDYYEQLSNLSKITGNLDKLSAWLEDQGDTLSYFNLYLKGLTESEKGLIENSISTYEFLIDNGFISKEIYYQLANTLRKSGNYEDAFISLSKAEKMCDAEDIFLSKIFNLKGTLFFLSGDYENARTEYEVFIKISKSN